MENRETTLEVYQSPWIGLYISRLAEGSVDTMIVDTFVRNNGQYRHNGKLPIRGYVSGPGVLELWIGDKVKV